METKEMAAILEQGVWSSQLYSDWNKCNVLEDAAWSSGQDFESEIPGSIPALTTNWICNMRIFEFEFLDHACE